MGISSVLVLAVATSNLSHHVVDWGVGVGGWGGRGSLTYEDWMNVVKEE